jgi:hypothetical protein
MEEGSPVVEGSLHSTLVEIVVPKDYDKISRYVDSPRRDFGQIRAYRPKDISKVRTALNAFLNNMKFENCKQNTSYIKAIGLWKGPVKAPAPRTPAIQRATTF